MFKIAKFSIFSDRNNCSANNSEFWIFMELISRFMEERNTPIERPPMLGFKQSINLELQHDHRANLTFVSVDLHMFFQKVLDQGGYEGCVSKKAWKSVYDELGGNPQNTSAATCTRRHYEKWVVIGDTKHTSHTVCHTFPYCYIANHVKLKKDCGSISAIGAQKLYRYKLCLDLCR